MKPSHIMSIMDIAWQARKTGGMFNPMFTGEAGLGKSQIVQQWVKKQRERNPNFGFIDLRIAYMEAPDMIGLPENELAEDKTKITSHYLPDFWPRDMASEGLLLFEEPNRAPTSTMQCLMQILTDRKVHKYGLPEGWMIAACVNPDSSEYDVNTMDAALKDRFVEFEIEFDQLSFIDYIQAKNWTDSIQRFVGDGIWIYKTSKELGQGGRYISPRTWSMVEAAERAGARNNRNTHRLIVTSILGKDIGNEYHKFCYDQAPVTAADLIKDQKAALAKLKEQSHPDTYKGDMIAATVDSIIKAYGGKDTDCKSDQISESVMAKVAKTIPSDLAVQLIKGCGFKQAKGKLSDFFGDFGKRYPDLIDILKANLKMNRATGVDKEKAATD